jgi:hypothetical protein
MPSESKSPSTEQAPIVDYGDAREGKISKRKPRHVPRWCCLPLPGTYLVVTRSDLVHPERIPIDTKRIYTIGSTKDADIVFSDLEFEMKLLHHRNGSVLISTPDSSRVNPVDENGIVRNTSGLFELDSDQPFAIGGLNLSITRNNPCRTLREHLQAGIAFEDDATRKNTIVNRDQRWSPPRPAKGLSHHKSNAQTPASVKAKTKRQRRSPDDIGKPRTVRFLE